tara:strand:+ start:950 stop:1807 length:858 start_codon:yes stop_codon:yes gene_type:complete
MSTLNKILIENISSDKLRNYFYNGMNKNFKQVNYDNVCEIFHKEINNIDLYGDISINEKKNLEHVFPKSYFKTHKDKEIMYSDMHNLFLCSSKLNHYRENFKYVDLEDYEFDYTEKFFDNEGNIIENNKDFYENQGAIMTVNKTTREIVPNDYSRGKVARSIAYFAIKYDCIDSIENIISIDTMIKWCLQDPVDNEEYFKNILCYKHQGNYNPFIIDSELIIYCFLDKINIDVDELLSLKKTKDIDYMKSIEYLIKENKNQYEEICSLNEKIKNLENEIVDLNIL